MYAAKAKPRAEERILGYVNNKEIQPTYMLVHVTPMMRISLLFDFQTGAVK